MTKSSKKQIDKDEKRIIAELQKNSGESIDKIAKKCGFSRQKVWRLMKRMEKTQSIWGYTAVADDTKLGVNTYFALIKKSTLPINEKLADKITVRQIEQLVPNTNVKVENSIYLHGPYDWLISFTAEDIRQAKKFCETLTRLYQGYIQDLQLMETLFPIRKQGLLNPQVEKLKDFL